MSDYAEYVPPALHGDFWHRLTVIPYLRVKQSGGRQNKVLICPTQDEYLLTLLTPWTNYTYNRFVGNSGTGYGQPPLKYSQIKSPRDLALLGEANRNMIKTNVDAGTQVACLTSAFTRGAASTQLLSGSIDYFSIAYSLAKPELGEVHSSRTHVLAADGHMVASRIRITADYPNCESWNKGTCWNPFLDNN